MQAQLLYSNNEHIFIEGTFYFAPKASYQIVTIRFYNIKEDLFHTVGYGVFSNKDISSYIELLANIKSYVFNSSKNKNNTEEKLSITIHCDFELALIREIKQVS